MTKRLWTDAEDARLKAVESRLNDTVPRLDDAVRQRRADRVFIVDDHAMNAELASYVLEADGLQVEVALDAIQALTRIEVCLPDVILMDIQLPGLDGLALTRLLKARPDTRHMAIVAFTAFAMKGDEAKMRGAGCDGYIAKPIDVAHFAAQVRECLAAVRSRQR